MSFQILDARSDASGGYKVDVSRGSRVGRVSSEWFSRPDDERFLSLTDLHASVKGRATKSRTRTVESAAIRVEAARDDAERLELLLPESGAPIAPTHWSFGQLSSLVGAPASYLRQLPAPLAAINLQYGLTTHRAEEGLWLFEDDRPDERLFLFVARLLGKKGRNEEAVAHLMRAFDKAPSLTLHVSLKSIGGDKASDAAIERLRSMIAASRPTARDARSDMLIEILMAEERYEEAWTVLRKRGAGERLALRVAEKSEKTHAPEVVALYRQHVESLVRMGGNRSYEEATKYVARLANLQNAAAHAAYVDDLRIRHKAKRNFIKLLG